MERINNRFYMNTELGESDIYRKFRYQFNQLLNSDEVAKTNDEFEELYVTDKELEDCLDEFRNSATHMIKCLVGYTGMGKSTVIRHCFSIGMRKRAVINRNRGELIFPTFLDGYQAAKNDKFDIISRVRATSSELIESYPELKDLLRTDEGKKELYAFIKNHTSFALEGINVIDRYDWDEKTLIKESLAAAESKFPFQYYANELKFCILKKYDVIKRLIIILDDIETLSEASQEDAITSFLKFFECMKNTDYPLDKNYNVNLLISVRPHTYRRQITSRRIEAFPISEPIIKNNAVDLSELFKKRFDYYTKQDNKIVGEKESWDKCYEALQKLNSQFDGKYKEMISELCFKNARQALRYYSIVFANRFWVQKNKLRESAFMVTEADYSFNNINVIRAIACKENEVFFESEDSIIPNIMYTTENDDRSMTSLILLQYYYIKTKKDLYGLSEEKIRDTALIWKQLCGNDFLDEIRESINYLFDIKILRKSIKSSDDGDDTDDHTKLTDDSALYISPRGAQLFYMLEQDSVLLEMMREATWRDCSIYKFNDKSSNELMSEKNQKGIFLDLLLYIEYLAEKEEMIHMHVKHQKKEELFLEVCSNTTICNRLLTGVKKSLEYSGLLSDKEIEERYLDVNKKIKNLMRGFPK